MSKGRDGDKFEKPEGCLKKAKKSAIRWSMLLVDEGLFLGSLGALFILCGRYQQCQVVALEAFRAVPAS